MPLGRSFLIGEELVGTPHLGAENMPPKRDWDIKLPPPWGMGIWYLSGGFDLLAVSLFWGRGVGLLFFPGEVDDASADATNPIGCVGATLGVMVSRRWASCVIWGLSCEITSISCISSPRKADDISPFRTALWAWNETGVPRSDRRSWGEAFSLSCSSAGIDPWRKDSRFAFASVACSLSSCWSWSWLWGATVAVSAVVSAAAPAADIRLWGAAIVSSSLLLTAGGVRDAFERCIQDRDREYARQGSKAGVYMEEEETSANVPSRHKPSLELTAYL